jgi:pyruvate dehydrogenase E2 component (dihydrolipoamide acetyltransferase)
MDVLMPQLGETVSEGKILSWFKSVGDAVKPGENLCEVETDKVTVEVPAIEGGILQAINVEAGTIAPVGAVIAVIGDGAAAVPTPAKAEPAKPVAAPAPAPAAAAAALQVVVPSALAAPAPPAAKRVLDPYHEVHTPTQYFGPARQNGIFVTPLARRLAAGAGINLAQVSGTGARGRITGGDIEKAVAARGAGAPVGTPATAEEPVGEVHRSRPHKVVALDGMRRTIARRLVQSKTTVPHFYLVADIDVDRLIAVRAEINAGAPKNAEGNPVYRLSLNDFMIKALALALQHVPQANAIWSSEGVLQYERSDVGVAVAIPGGLLTPVIVSADTKPLSAISNEMKDLAKRARTRALQPQEYQGGTTSLSNLGMYGVREFSAIINPPQATILAVGASDRRPVETKDGGVAFVSRISATLSCDHRVVDGALGAELLTAFKTLMEHPLRMVV